MKRELSANERPFIMVCGDYVRTGGQDAANLAVADYLSRNGREVHVVGYRFDAVLTKRPLAHLHRIHKLGNSYTMGAPVLTSSGLAQYLLRFSKRPHVIANGGNCPTPSANWVHYVHAANRPRSTLLRRRAAQAIAYPISRVTELIALHAARVVIANSDRTRKDVVELLRVPEERVRTVYYGMDPERFPPTSDTARRDAAAELGWPLDRFRAVFIGALGDSRKGLDRLYEAWTLLCRDRQWDGELVVVGIGAELESWRRRAREDGLTDRISFLGFRPDVPRILAASDALIAPTRYEAYGLGVHEAICVGLPALVSASAGVAERYPSSLQSLLISDPEDARGIADSVCALRKSIGQLKDPVAALGKIFRSRTWDDMACDIERLCDAHD